jgi:hypothetical protein
MNQFSCFASVREHIPLLSASSSSWLLSTTSVPQASQKKPVRKGSNNLSASNIVYFARQLGQIYPLSASSFIVDNHVRDVVGNNRWVNTHVSDFVIDGLPHLSDAPFDEIHEYGIVYVVVFAHGRAVGVGIPLLILGMTTVIQCMQGSARR